MHLKAAPSRLGQPVFLRSGAKQPSWNAVARPFGAVAQAGDVGLFSAIEPQDRPQGVPAGLHARALTFGLGVPLQGSDPCNLLCQHVVGPVARRCTASRARPSGRTAFPSVLSSPWHGCTPSTSLCHVRWLNCTREAQLPNRANPSAVCWGGAVSGVLNLRPGPLFIATCTLPAAFADIDPGPMALLVRMDRQWDAVASCTWCRPSSASPRRTKGQSA